MRPRFAPGRAVGRDTTAVATAGRGPLTRTPARGDPRRWARSGKTKVICHRVAYLVQHENVTPSAIALVTFTNKGARHAVCPPPPPFQHTAGVLTGRALHEPVWLVRCC